jgi:hypothetical protein
MLEGAKPPLHSNSLSFKGEIYKRRVKERRSLKTGFREF